MTDDPRLALRDVRVRRGGREILDVPALDVHEGEVLAVIGPNGGGKSTLLLLLALLERPDTGDVIIDGRPVWTKGGRAALAQRRRMAVVFQDPLLLDAPAQTNVETGLRLRGVPRRERGLRAMRWLERFGIATLGRRQARTLSGGEAQRVSLARAFALEPEVLLLDEPFSALDQPTREALTEALARVLAETRLTAVLVTHDRDEAARLGKRVAVLMQGRVRQIGTPTEVFGAPSDEEVAAFVGIETIVAASVVSKADGLVRLQAGTHVIEAVHAGAFSEALVCLRPEDVSILQPSERMHDSARNKVAGRIRRIVRTGADARVEIDAGFPIVARITVRSLDDLGLELGAAVVASFKATAVHLIPK